MNKTRLTRIDDEIQKEIAEIIRAELKDPRLNKLITVTRVNTTNDLKLCKVFVSIMAEGSEKKDAMEGLNNSAGFIRRQIASRINLRNTPEFSFVIDESLDESYRMSKILDDIKNS